jgi:Na+-transporting methylmalonyl-CoA/oxaloacetate decarboxylase gamma subunit
MEPESYQPYPWTQFAPQLPSPGEFAILVLYTGALILAGKLFKHWWTRNNETVPIPVALGMGISMIFMFLLLIVAFYNRSVGSQEIIKVVMEDGREMNAITPDSRYFGLLLWCMIAFVFPLFYYGLIIVNSFASRVIDRVSPFGMQIHEPSEFAEARKLALRGDVDGAVKRYRSYLENTEDALFEAARLLKAEDRFAEAAALFQEISERFYGKKTDMGRSHLSFGQAT